MDNVISREKMEALISTSVQLIGDPGYASFIRSYNIREIRPGYVSFFDYIAIWKKLIASNNDPLLPCKIGERAHIADLGVPGLIMMHSGTLALALKSAASYKQLISDCFILTSDFNSSELKVSLSVKDLDEDFDWHHVVLNLFSQFIKTINFLTNNLHSAELKLVRVGFSREIKNLESVYSSYFRCPTYGSQPENYLVIPIQILELPIHNSQKHLFETLTKIGDRSLESLRHKNYSYSVLRTLRTYTFPAMARIDSVSQNLNLSAATLKRKLQAEDTSFSQLKDSLLLDEAQRIIDLGYSSPDYIAKALGYSDGSSFSKAFKRWTGSTLEGYVKRNRRLAIQSVE